MSYHAFFNHSFFLIRKRTTLCKIYPNKLAMSFYILYTINHVSNNLSFYVAIQPLTSKSPPAEQPSKSVQYC